MQFKMKKCLVIPLLLIGTWCLTRVESQCKDQVASQFSAQYFRMIRIGNDNYEHFDGGNMTHDGIGQRNVFMTVPSPTTKVTKEFVCYDYNMGHKRVEVLSDGSCKVSQGYFFKLEVPSEDEYKGEVSIGEKYEKMDESVYFGYSDRERNEFILTTAKCGPVRIAVSIARENFHVRFDLFGLTTQSPTDAFTIKCNGQQDAECSPVPPSN